MKRIPFAGTLGVVVLVAAGLVLSKPTIMKTTATVRADEGAGCSLATAAGNWAFTNSGTVVGIGPRAAVGKFTLDEEGNLVNGVATSSLNGSIADETFYGTYTVNHDCTGTINVRIFVSGTEIFEVTGNTAFDEKMEQLRGLFTSVVEPNGTSLPTVITLDARRQ